MNSILTRQFNLRSCQDWPFANPDESLISPVSLFFPSLLLHSLHTRSPPAPLFYSYADREYTGVKEMEREGVCVRGGVRGWDV